jgi:hypothetical protein
VLRSSKSTLELAAELKESAGFKLVTQEEDKIQLLLMTYETSLSPHSPLVPE